MTHWKKFMNPNFIGAYAFDDPQEEMIVTIDRVGLEDVKNQSGTEEKLVVHFRDDVKPLIINTTNAKAITAVAGSPQVENWIGVKITLFVTEVSAFGQMVDAVRVRSKAPKPVEKVALSAGQIKTLKKKIKDGEMSMEKAVSLYNVTADDLT